MKAEKLMSGLLIYISTSIAIIFHYILMQTKSIILRLFGLLFFMLAVFSVAYLITIIFDYQRKHDLMKQELKELR